MNLNLTFFKLAENVHKFAREKGRELHIKQDTKKHDTISMIQKVGHKKHYTKSMTQKA